MTSLDLSRLSGPDAVSALRSYPRRYRSAVLPVPDDPDAEELATRIAPSGHSALELVVNTASSWVLIGRALHQVLIDHEPVLHPAVADAAEREWEVPPGTTVVTALERLDDEATALADALERVHGAEWNRIGRVAGAAPTDQAITALDLAKTAVSTGSDNLHRVDATLASLRPR